MRQVQVRWGAARAANSRSGILEGEGRRGPPRRRTAPPGSGCSRRPATSASQPRRAQSPRFKPDCGSFNLSLVPTQPGPAPHSSATNPPLAQSRGTRVGEALGGPTATTRTTVAAPSVDPPESQRAQRLPRPPDRLGSPAYQIASSSKGREHCANTALSAHLWDKERTRGEGSFQHGRLTIPYISKTAA